MQPSKFIVHTKWSVGILGNDVLFLQNKRTPATTRKPNHKHTNKKENMQNLVKQTQPSCAKNGSMYNSVALRKVWDKDSYLRREYAQRGMCNLKNMWVVQ